MIWFDFDLKRQNAKTVVLVSWLSGTWPHPFTFLSAPNFSERCVLSKVFLAHLVSRLSESTFWLYWSCCLQTPGEWADHDAYDAAAKHRSVQSHRRHPSLNGCLSFTADVRRNNVPVFHLLQQFSNLGLGWIQKNGRGFARVQGSECNWK